MSPAASVDWHLAFRIFLPTFFVVFILVGGPLSVFAFKRKYGFDPLALQEPDPVMEFGERYRDLLFGTVLALTSLYAVRPEVHRYLGAITWLESNAVRSVGVALMLASLVTVRVAQLQLKSSWRYGVDRAHPPDELVTTGLFARSRNPIYLGMIVTAVGLFLALPNAVTFAVPNLAYVLLQTRVRAEEVFMEETFGARYRDYRQRTARWLIGPKG